MGPRSKMMSAHQSIAVRQKGTTSSVEGAGREQLSASCRLARRKASLMKPLVMRCHSDGFGRIF